MRSNIKLGTVSGIEIGLHYSWFIIAALIVFSLVDRFRETHADWTRNEIWTLALITAAFFFVSLLLHELAHSWVAQKRGLRVKAITLFALGGVSQIQDDSSDAKTEFWVAIAGPIASLVIGVGCLILALELGWQRSAEPHSAATGILVWLGRINITLAIFNMIPAFPLDGGRVLRAIVWAVTKDATRSTRIAARVGQVAAFLFILDGIWNYFSGAGFGGLWIAFIGWFLMDAARSTSAGLETRPAAVQGARVSDVMSRGCIAVNPGMRLQEFVDVYLLKTAQRCFAIKDHDRLAGLITRRDVGAIPRERWGTTTVGEAMRPLRELQVVTPDTRVLDALKIAASNGVDPLPVVENGRLQGVVFRSQLLQALQVQSQMKLLPAYGPLFYRNGKAARSGA
jgi:Zn-dependent protease/predicted transcriptional regulator